MNVYLTAWNDQQSIGQVVREFIQMDCVKRVIVIDNNSSDFTRDEALGAGADVIVENQRGYGHVVYRDCVLVSWISTRTHVACLLHRNISIAWVQHTYESAWLVQPGALGFLVAFDQLLRFFLMMRLTKWVLPQRRYSILDLSYPFFHMR